MDDEHFSGLHAPTLPTVSRARTDQQYWYPCSRDTDKVCEVTACQDFGYW
jgi:hypothetical protein